MFNLLQMVDVTAMVLSKWYKRQILSYSLWLLAYPALRLVYWDGNKKLPDIQLGFAKSMNVAVQVGISLMIMKLNVGMLFRLKAQLLGQY